MKIKVSLFDPAVAKRYVNWISPISVICSFLFIAVDIPKSMKSYFFLGIGVLLIVVYFGVWAYANCSQQKRLSIDGSPFLIKVGDLFMEQGLIVIPFNEYFDTKVDNEIISHQSLNGKFIEQYVSNPCSLDEAIKHDPHLEEFKVPLKNQLKQGDAVRQKYRLGSIHKYSDRYLLLAFSHFDDRNRAYLSMRDYVNCLMSMWEEIDVLYAGRSVSIPLLGGGITRFKDITVDDEELLQLVIWSFKISRVKFKYPAKVTVVISTDTSDKINFFKQR